MDTTIPDWLAHSPQCATDGAEDLACVDQWLNHGAIDISPIFVDDEIVRSLEDLNGQEFFSDSPPPFADHELEPVAPQQLSVSSQPTSSGDGPSNSGDAVCGDAFSADMGHLGRGGTFRSFSTNDLQLLLEQQANMLPPVTAFSAPPHQYLSHVGMAAAKARGRPALESVPEGAPSPVAPLPIPPATQVIPSRSGGDCAADSGIGGNSLALGASPGTCSLEFLSRTALEPSSATTAIATPAYIVPPANCGNAVLSPVPADAAPAPCTGASEPGRSPAPARNTGSGLRPVPSMGTLSALIDNSLSFQREGTDESMQQQQQQISEGCVAVALPAISTAVHTPHPGGVPGVAASIDLSSSAVTAAAAAGVFPVASVTGLSQPFTLPPSPAGYYGMAPHLYPLTTSFLPGSYPLGFSLPPPAPTMFADACMGCGGAAAVVAAGSKATEAAAPAARCSGIEAATAGGAGGGPPGLRKSQSALELCAWRSCSLELGGDVAENLVTGQKLIGRLTPEERMQRILRYRSKRNSRNFNREIKYQCRKTLADSRPRVGGRFARNDDPNSVLPHQTKKALRMKQSPAPAVVVAAAITAKGNPVGGGNGSKPGTATVAASAAAFKAVLRTQAAALATTPDGWLQQSLQPGAALPTSSSSTTTASSGSSDNQFASCSSSSGKAAAAVASVAMPAAVIPPGTGPSSAVLTSGGAVATCGLPLSYSLTGMPYVPQGLIPAGIPPPPGATLCNLNAPPHMHHHRHHHYAVANAAALVATQGVYAHLGMAPVTTVGALSVSPQSSATVSGAFASAVEPLGGAAAATAGVMSPVRFVGPKAEGTNAPAASILDPVSGQMPARVESSSMNALWARLGTDLRMQVPVAVAAAVPGEEETEEGPQSAQPAAAVATCMAVDG